MESVIFREIEVRSSFRVLCKEFIFVVMVVSGFLSFFSFSFFFTSSSIFILRLCFILYSDVGLSDLLKVPGENVFRIRSSLWKGDLLEDSLFSSTVSSLSSTTLAKLKGSNFFGLLNLVGEKASAAKYVFFLGDRVLVTFFSSSFFR